MSRLVLLIRSPRLLMKVLARLRARACPVDVDTGARSLRSNAIVLTDDLDRALALGRQGITTILVNEEDYKGKVELALLMTRGKTLFKELVIGVDPGAEIGFVVIGDGSLLEAERLTSVESLLSMVREILETYPYRRCFIRVGNMGVCVDDIVCGLVELLREMSDSSVVLELVDEMRTAKDDYVPARLRLQGDTLSAFLIALRRGMRVEVRRSADERA